MNQRLRQAMESLGKREVLMLNPGRFSVHKTLASKPDIIVLRQQWKSIPYYRFSRNTKRSDLGSSSRHNSGAGAQIRAVSKIHFADHCCSPAIMKSPTTLPYLQHIIATSPARNYFAIEIFSPILVLTESYATLSRRFKTFITKIHRLVILFKSDLTHRTKFTTSKDSTHEAGSELFLCLSA